MRTLPIISTAAAIVALAVPAAASARPATDPAGVHTNAPQASSPATIAAHREAIGDEQWQRAQADQPAATPLSDRTTTDESFPIVPVVLALGIALPLSLLLVQVVGKPALTHARRRHSPTPSA